MRRRDSSGYAPGKICHRRARWHVSSPHCMNIHTPSKALILTLLAASAALAEDAKVAAPAPAEQPAAARRPRSPPRPRTRTHSSSRSLAGTLASAPGFPSSASTPRSPMRWRRPARLAKRVGVPVRDPEDRARDERLHPEEAVGVLETLKVKNESQGAAFFAKLKETRTWSSCRAPQV